VLLDYLPGLEHQVRRLVKGGECVDGKPRVSFVRKRIMREVVTPPDEGIGPDSVLVRDGELSCQDYQTLSSIGAKVVSCVDCPFLLYE